jgi:MOSC domain-containing protein YiiM
MRLDSIQVGLPRERGTPGAERGIDRAWTSAFYKDPVDGPVWLGLTNLDGDRQGDQKNHGGPDKAVLAYASSHYPAWREELGMDLPHGGFAENFTVDGANESTVCLGDVWSVGEARVQVSQPREPCWKIARRWGMKDLSARVQRTGRTGWYLRVLHEGHVEAGDEVVLLDRPYPEWPIARINAVLYDCPRDVDLVMALAANPALAKQLREVLVRYFAQPHGPPEEPRLIGPNE